MRRKRNGRKKRAFFKRLVAGASKTRENIVSGIDAIFSGFSSIDDDFYDEIEEILVMGDIGINATTAIIEDLRQKVKDRGIKDPAGLQAASDRQHQAGDGRRARRLMNLKTESRSCW